MTLPPELGAWRKSERARLLARRTSVAATEHTAWNSAITASLLQGFPSLASLVVSFYWPFKGEFDPRFAIHGWRSQGARVALPEVLEKNMPLQFRQWWPGVKTRAGVYDLPVPEATAILLPDAALIPPIGFDAQGYRLGYGGGYFDRTLAALSPQPLKIGVAYELSRIETIRPQAHDIAMDFIVTEAGIHMVRGSSLERVNDVQEVHEGVDTLLRERGLPRSGPA
jgi:5-formyltetrahydrofolate cyclo-ligase